jgi:hypothetical protein
MSIEEVLMRRTFTLRPASVDRPPSRQRSRYTRLAAAVVTPGVVAISSVLLGGASPSAAASVSYTPQGNAVSISPTSDDDGYVTITANGTVSAYGDATFASAPGGSSPVVGIVQVGDAGDSDGGFWTVSADGGVFSVGGVSFFGSMGGHVLDAPIVGMAATPDDQGYWLVAADGGVFSFGDASFYGSMGGKSLDAPVVGMAASSLGGYWLVAADGGVFSFGAAPFLGSMGGKALNAPISGIAATMDGRGYWLVGEDNGVFTFGDAGFFGPTYYP